MTLGYEDFLILLLYPYWLFFPSKWFFNTEFCMKICHLKNGFSDGYIFSWLHHNPLVDIEGSESCTFHGLPALPTRGPIKVIGSEPAWKTKVLNQE